MTGEAPVVDAEIRRIQLMESVCDRARQLLTSADHDLIHPNSMTYRGLYHKTDATFDGDGPQISIWRYSGENSRADDLAQFGLLITLRPQLTMEANRDDATERFEFVRATAGGQIEVNRLFDDGQVRDPRVPNDKLKEIDFWLASGTRELKAAKGRQELQNRRKRLSGKFASWWHDLWTVV